MRCRHERRGRCWGPGPARQSATSARAAAPGQHRCADRTGRMACDSLSVYRVRLDCVPHRADAADSDPNRKGDAHRRRRRGLRVDHAVVAGLDTNRSGMPGDMIDSWVDPVRATRLWGDPEEPTPTAQLLLRSMGYRDALIGGLLMAAALRGKNTRGWFLAPAGADAADLLGGLSVHSELKPAQRLIGLGGAVVGIGVGLWGAARRTTRA